MIHAFAGANSIIVNEVNNNIQEYKHKVSILEKQLQIQREELEWYYQIKVDESNSIHAKEYEKFM